MTKTYFHFTIPYWKEAVQLFSFPLHLYSKVMNVYLDIDGVLLHEGRPAPFADELVEYLVNNFSVYWLTIHCMKDGDNPLSLLAKFFPPETLEHLKRVRPTSWKVLKIEGINFQEKFVWIEDIPTAQDILVLRSRNLLDSLIEVNLHENPNQLQELLVNPKLKVDQIST